MAWISSLSTKSGFAVAVIENAWINFDATQCRFFEVTHQAMVLAPSPSYVEEDYVDAGYVNTYGSGDDSLQLMDHGKVFHDPMYLPFVNRGYTRDYNCDPHDDGDYVEEIFPDSSSVAGSILAGKNVGIVGSKRRSAAQILSPVTSSTEVVYDSSNIAQEFIA